jgi:hypothetical protein
LRIAENCRYTRGGGAGITAAGGHDVRAFGNGAKRA